MEEQKDIISQQESTPPVTIVPPVVEKEKKNSNGGLIALIIVLFLIVLGLLGYVLYLSDVSFVKNLFSQEQQQEDKDIEVESNDGQKVEVDTDNEEDEGNSPPSEETGKLKVTEFMGESVIATLPEGWSIEEFFNGEGTTYLVGETEYSGLTALKIFNGSTQVFHVSAVSGIGFVGCPKYYVFDDNSTTYQSNQQDSVDEIGDNMEIIDYTTDEYSEFDWMGKTYRRIDKQYIYDSQPGNSYFEPPCFLGITTLDGLTFNDETHSYPGSSYFFGATEAATDSDLEVLDTILQSMEAI